MRNKLSRVFVTLTGMSLGVGVSELALTLLPMFGIIAEGSAAWPIVTVTVYIAGIFFGLLLALLFGAPVIKALSGWLRKIETTMQDMPMPDIIFGAVGLLITLVIASLVTVLFRGLNIWLQIPLGIALYVMFGYFGIIAGSKRWREVPMLRRFSERERSVDNPWVKILDTSAIIDGRIEDICKTGFVEGTLNVPSFVLRELQQIADSSDASRRKRGRRGLDTISRMQKELNNIFIDERDYPNIEEVDAKLLKMAEETGGKIITNDFNLNKVAEVTGAGILNINELANALKTLMLPGEEITVRILKEGKEAGQGVAYLDDGTMVVVEGAKGNIGKSVSVQVTSVLQTPAGRMVFAKLAVDL